MARSSAVGDIAMVGVAGIAGLALWRASKSAPSAKVTTDAAADAIADGGTNVPRTLVTGDPATGGVSSGWSSTDEADAASGRTPTGALPYPIGTFVQVPGGTVVLVRIDDASRTFTWQLNRGPRFALPWNERPGNYTWTADGPRRATSSPNDDVNPVTRFLGDVAAFGLDFPANPEAVIDLGHKGTDWIGDRLRDAGGFVGGFLLGGTPR